MTVTVWVVLFRDFFAFVPVRGCCIHSALAGQCQQAPTPAGYGEGLQHPALGNGFLWSGQEGCSFSGFIPSPPSIPSPSAPPTQVDSGHLRVPPFPRPSLPPLPSPTLPSEHPAWKASVPPWLPSGPALMPCLFPSRWEQVLRVGSKPAQTRGLYNQQAALKVLCHSLELPQ